MTKRITWILIILITIGGVISADAAIDGIIGWWNGKEMTGFQIFSLCYFSIACLIVPFAIMTAEQDPDDVINRDDENC